MDELTRKVQALDERPTQILSSDGKVLYQVSSENRTMAKLSDIPVMTRNAIIAAEDKRFYEHSGVDFIGVIRSMREVARTQRATQGASTLTMQLAKLLSDGSQKTLTRKMDDVALAIYMERQMTKDQILEMYLNTVYFGEGAYGIAAAARVYFDKDVKDLTIAESAMLARCVRRPVINPIHDLPRALDNRNVVLGVMRDEHMIDPSQYASALAEKPHVNSRPQRTSAILPNGSEYFVDHVKRLLELELPGVDLKTGGYTIETTLDSRIERRAEQAIRENVKRFRSYGVNTAAIVVIDRDGEILAEVGGADYRRNSYNAVYQGRMQPGSGFKPFVYASAFKDGIIQSADDMVSNAPIHKIDPSAPNGVWSPQNDNKNETKPSYTVRTALADSINLPAIHTIENVGPAKVVEYARDNFGFQSKLGPYDPLALGASEVSPLEMAEAYSVFMLKGDRVRPFAIKRIIGPDGEVVREFQPQVFKGVWDPGICEKIDALLKDVVDYGTAALPLPDGTRLSEDIPDARGKTGTTSKNIDAWFNGYADGLLAVGWCTNEVKVNGVYVRKRMGAHAFGGTVTVPIWRDVMQYALKVRPQTPIVSPVSEAKADEAAGAKFGTGDDEDASKDPDKPHPDPGLQKPALIPTTPGGDPDEPVTTLGGTPSPDQPAVPSQPAAPGQAPADTSAPAKAAAPADVPKPTKPKKSDQDEYVEVEICDATGLKATMYCPETTTRRFKKGTEPKKFCNVHTGNQDGRK
jgi:penicillin-binding protein 1A